MSRLKRFTHAMISGYVLVGMNVVYTLASVPLALHYLTKEEFGLWALTSQIAGYLAMIDLGMGSSIARILIDVKDHRAGGCYGGVIKTGVLVSALQGGMVLAGGGVLVFFLAEFLQIPAKLAGNFFWLMVGQVVITAASFVSRMFAQVLSAWQRMDVSNYSAVVQLLVSLLVLWAGFSLGLGVMSLVAGLAVGWLVGAAICAFACRHLGLLPQRGEWGDVSWVRARELFHFATAVFLIALGTQLIMSSQTVLVSRLLGMEAAALWSVMTKIFTLSGQLVWRVIGNTQSAFAEMHVRREQDRLWKRYRALFVATSVMAAVCGVFLVACNGPFVGLWTHGRFSWPVVNDVLLGLWLVVLTQQCCHSSLITCFKEIRGLKYVFLAEGIAVIGSVWVVLPRFGITGMLICSLLATLSFTWSYGTWRMTRLAGIVGWKNLLWDWQRPLFRVVGIMVPCWLVTEWTLRGAPDWLRLVINGALLTVIGMFVSLRFALPSDFITDMIGKLPLPLRRVAGFIVRRRHCGQNTAA